MSDSVDRTRCGDIYAELSGASKTGVQIRLGDPEAGKLFEVQLCSHDGVFQGDEHASEIAITVIGRDKVVDLAFVLRSLADMIEKHSLGEA